MAPNPLYRSNEDPVEPGPLVELKTRLVLYLSYPPGPVTMRRLYDLYMRRFGDQITAYRSTTVGSEPEEWTPETRARFETVELPDLRQQQDWGYMFGSEKPIGSGVFMFHGSRPFSEKGRASIIRFDFEWDFDRAVLRQFTASVLDVVDCVCGTAGYVLSADAGDYAAPASALMFAWAMRYWGAEAQDLDASVEVALGGFPCVSWLTMIGPELRGRAPEAIAQARAVAYASAEVNGHVIIQAEEVPRLIDRNRQETLGNFAPVARALLPFQVEQHQALAGDSWDEENTRRYMHRFTRPDDV